MRAREVLPLSVLSLALAPLASADVVTDWNAQALSAIQAAGSPPPAASRALAIVSASVYDAVNSVDRTHAPYMVDTIATPGTDRQAAAIAAASSALAALYPAQAATFNTLRTTQLSLIPDSAGKSAGISLGDSIATSITTTRTTDGSATVAPPYTGGTGIGQWRPTPPANANGLLPAWGNVTPFSINSGAQFRPSAPPAIGSPEYTAAYNEVKAIGRATGSTRTQDQTDIARAWAFGGGTITPPGGWNKIASDLSAQRSLSLSDNARMFAMLNVAQADAAIACWDAKYVFSMWRPITAINEGENDLNPGTAGDAAWTSLLTTPNFPTFTSGHSTFSRASATILAYFLGGDAISLSFQGDNGIMRSLTSLNEAANEAGLSRIYGGIHFSFDNTAGQQCGLDVANWVIANDFQAIPAPGAAGLGLVVGLFAARRRRRRR
jgi:hypothetical protein